MAGKEGLRDNFSETGVVRSSSVIHLIASLPSLENNLAGFRAGTWQELANGIGSGTAARHDRKTRDVMQLAFRIATPMKRGAGNRPPGCRMTWSVRSSDNLYSHDDERGRYNYTLNATTQNRVCNDR